ncbi:MAG: hypothetical protein AABZ14_09290 [Candidatus Margulisiibacteriota bacterium]
MIWQIMNAWGLMEHQVENHKIKVIETTLMCWEHELGWVVLDSFVTR